MTYQVSEPVKNDKGELCWLIDKGNKPVSTVSKDKSIKQIIKQNNPIDYKQVFELKPEGLWQCRKCGAQMQSSPNPPLECYKEQGGCDRSTNFEIVTKTINTDLWKLPNWNDIPLDDIDIQGLFVDIKNLMKQCLIFVEDIHYTILTLWIISTWKLESWNTVGFPTFLGMVSSGKSKCLDFINEIGYRMINSSGITFPAIVRASHYHNAGILMDEVQNRLNPKDESGREYINFIKPSYRRGNKYTVADKEDQENLLSYRNFGFKAFAGERGFDLGLMDRTILFEMEQDYPEVTNFKEIETDFDIMRTRLLNYRYKTQEPESLDTRIFKNSRTHEIFESIIATGKHIGTVTDDIIDYAKKCEIEKEEELQDTIEWNILEIIKNKECNETLDDAPTETQYGDIVTALGWEPGRKSSQSLGYIITKKFRLITKRKTSGTVILLTNPKNERKLKYLFKRYKL